MRLRCPSCLLAAVALVAVLFPQQIAASAQSSSPSSQRATASVTAPHQDKANCTNNGTYVNSRGQTVKRPEDCSSAPQGATAQCRDGTYSFSMNRRGTCSHHGGVANWL
jgi:hypothetical protein